MEGPGYLLQSPKTFKPSSVQTSLAGAYNLCVYMDSNRLSAKG